MKLTPRQFELAHGVLVEEMPFVPHPTIENFGASPDGRIDAKTGVEIKCPTTARYLAWRLAGVVPEEHKPQMIAQCLCAGFESVWFVAYDPRLPRHLQLMALLYTPTEEERATVEAAAREFLTEVDAMFEQLTATKTA